MAINIALGNLFLSGGTLTYSNDINSVAMLLCSLITPFPSDEADNKHHLQALRHFSALAVESRYLSCVDFESKQECIVSCFVLKSIHLNYIRFLSKCT
jgi:anaphase-promoting complex subunit 1